jgi:two-component system nitrogen regulation response regulator NtrX
MPARVLLIDDERAARVALRRVLKGEGYEILEASDGREGLALIDRESPELAILDLNMPGLGGMEVLQALADATRPEERRPAIIVLTAYGNEKLAVAAMKAGAYDYLTKPYDVEALRMTVAKALERSILRSENQRLRQQLAARDSPSRLIGESAAIRSLRSAIEKVAPLDVSVLLRGESGSGKELVARAIHEQSSRSRGPFVAINAAAIPEKLVESELFGHRRGAFTGAETDRKGKFELAHRGTLLLDEIGDMSLETQARLLRALEERVIEPLGAESPIPVDVRVIAATHKDLLEEIHAERFRPDLYYRLKVVELNLPRLADRREDIPLLVAQFIKDFTNRHGRAAPSLSRAALEALQAGSWPGNVRELKNLVEGALVMCSSPVLDAQDLPLQAGSQASPGPAESAIPAELYKKGFAEARRLVLRDFELRYIEHHLTVNRGNISRTAQALELSRQGLQQKLKDLGLSSHRFREP